MSNPEGAQPPEKPRRRQKRSAEGQPYRQRWANEVLKALQERNLSISRAAAEAGLTQGALNAWLHQDVEPNPRALKALAEVIGRSHIQLVHWLGILPDELSDVPVRLEATEKLREALADTQRWVEAAGAATGLSSGSLVANALLSTTSEWRVTMDPAERGERFPAPYEIRIAFAPRKGQAEAGTDADRKRILAHVRDAFRRTSAEWRDPSESEGWEPRPDLVLVAPSLLASRPRAEQPNFEVPESILVVGVPYAGGRTVAALLSGLLGWAYNDVGTVARERFGEHQGEPFLRAQTEVAKRLLREPAVDGRLMVWSYASLEPIGDTIELLDAAADSLPLVIFLKADDQLLEYAARRTEGDLAMVDSVQNVARVDSVQNTVRWQLRKRRDSYPDGQLTLDLHLPEGMQVDTSSARDEHLLFDAYVEQAVAAAAWLHERHRGPALEEAQGLLADLWRGSRQH